MHLASLYRFPLKSGSAELLQQERCDELGLCGDRRWMVVDAASGKFLTQRMLPGMALLNARWQGDAELLLTAPGMDALAVAVPEESGVERGVLIWRESLQVPDAGDAAAAELFRLALEEREGDLLQHGLSFWPAILPRKTAREVCHKPTQQT